MIVGRGRSASLALALLTIGCYPAGAPDALTEGLWSGGDGTERFVFEFTGSHLGAHAVVHVMEGGRKVTEKPAKRAVVDMPWLEVRVDDRFSYRGRIDLERKIIEGEIVDATPTPRKYDLQWVASGTVPGLLARPVPRPGEPVYAYARPPDLGDGWPTATPDEVGIDPGGIRDLVGAVIAGEAGVIHSLLVVRHGKLVLEEYFHSTRARLRTTGSEEYGYLWWLSRLADDGGHGEAVIFASGWGSQFVYALPSSSTTVVITGGNEFNGKTRDHRKLLVEHLIPAVRS